MFKKALLIFAIAMVLLVLACAPALADGPLGRVTYTARVSGAEFTDLAINASKTTDAIRTNGWNQIAVLVSYTYSGALYVNMTCYEQFGNDTTTWYVIPMCNDSSPPTSRCGLLTKQWDVDGASEDWRWMIPVFGKYFQCTFVTTGGDSGDKASIKFAGGEQ
jgi:hypothetical protein